jgi:hypothetical protein
MSANSLSFLCGVNHYVFGLDVAVDDAFVAALVKVEDSRAQINYNLVPSRGINNLSDK